MKTSLVILLFIPLFFSCTGKEKKPPVLSQVKMREVMWDMMRADQFVFDYVTKDSTKKVKPESIKLYDEIFRIHNISQKEFKTSLDYYSSRPDLFRPIIDSLALRRSAGPPPPIHPTPGFHPPVKDSVKKHLPPRHFPKS